MTNSLELLEDVQKTYAVQSDLTVMLTDQRGELLLPAEGENTLCNTLIQQEEKNLLGEIKQSLREDWDLSTAIFYDLLPGVQVVVAPVENGKEANYFLWAGVMVEEQNIPLVTNQLKTKFNKEIDWESLLEQTPVLTKENKRQWISRANKLAELTSLCLQQEKTTSGYSLPTELLQEMTQDVERGFANILSRFLTHYQAFDFLGVAEKQEEDVYQVVQVAGNGMDPLLGSSFSMGEGYLGRVLLTGKQAYWENIDQDPRSNFFHSCSLYPKSLFCEPVKQHDGSVAVLFGGSFTRKQISAEEAALGKMLGALQEVSFSIHSLRMENTQQLSRLTSLIDICRLMASTPDLKRVLFILVDISINLTEGPFSCVVMKDKESEKVKLISRGEAKGSIGEYAKDIVNRYYPVSNSASSEWKEPQVRQTKEGERVIECPLLHGEELLGVLCVGVGDHTHVQLTEHLAFLHTLSIIGGVSLQLTRQGEASQEEGKIEAVHRAVEQFEPDAFTVSEEAAILAAEFTMEINLTAPTVKQILHACQLAFYSADFVRQTFSDSRIPIILEEGKALSDSQNSKEANEPGVDSLIFALVYTYVKSNYDLKAVAPLKNTAGETYQEFISYIKNKQVAEAEFTMAAPDADNREIKSVAMTIKKQMNLSPREQEVLELVMKGLNNREIAETLFISDHTVKNHITKIFQKLGVSDRAHAITKVYQQMYE